MANRSYYQRMYSLHPMPIMIDVGWVVGASGAVGTVKGTGVKSVTKIATGTYQIQFQDNYNRLFSFFGGQYSPSTGSTAITALATGIVYVIATLGTSTQADWVAAGLNAGVTPAVGVSFVATGVGTGTGTASMPATSSLSTIEIVGNPNLTLAPIGAVNQGGYIIVQTLQSQQTGTTTNGTLVPTVVANPVQNTLITLVFELSNSSVLVQGE